MASREELQSIAAGVTRDMIGQPVSVAGNTPVGVWPGGTTVGRRPTQVLVRPITNPAWVRFDTAADNVRGAQLFGDTEYVIPLHPSVNTIHLFAPAATTVALRWVVSD